MFEQPDRHRETRELFYKSLRLGLVHKDSAEVEYYYGKEQPNVIRFKRGADDRAVFERSMIPIASDQLREAARERAQVAMDQAREYVDRRERRDQFPYAAE